MLIDLTDLPDIRTHLSHGSEEMYSFHPFIMAKASFSSEVVYMLDQSVENILQSGIRTVAVDCLYILCNVVDC